MVSRERLYTVGQFEDYIAQPENVDRLFELINGEIVEKVPTELHGEITVNISTGLKIHVKQTGMGRVVVEVRHRVSGDEHNDRLPDVAYYANPSQPSIKKGAVPYMPDLAVEIKSPNDTYQRLRDKAAYYLANGTRIVWLVYPEKRAVEVQTLDDFDYVSEDGTLDGGDVLPGFTMPVRDIFPQK
jgi:Uma2 family endonuclease